jgi:ApeA N-terminal domain 1
MIHGLTAQNLEFTLVDLSGEDHGSNLGTGGQSLSAAYCVVGKHLQPNELQFSKLRFGATGLNRSVARPPLALIQSQPKLMTMAERAERWFRRFTKTPLATIEPKPIGLSLSEHAGPEISHNGATIRLRYSHLDKSLWGVKAYPFVEITVREPLELREWITRLVNPLNQLFALAAVAPSELVFLCRAEPILHNGTSDDQELAILGSGLTGDLASVTSTGRPRAKLISAEEFPAVWPVWLTLRDRAAVAIDLYLETVFRQNELSSRHRFLNLVQALESIHSNLDRQFSRPEADYKSDLEFAKVALNASGFTTEIKKFIKSHLRSNLGNSVPLSTRLNELRERVCECHRPDPVVPVWVGPDYEQKTWGDHIQKARNIVSHGGGKVPEDWLRSAGDDLARTMQNEILLRLEFSEDLVHKRLHN